MVRSVSFEELCGGLCLQIGYINKVTKLIDWCMKMKAFCCLHLLPLIVKEPVTC